MPIFTTPGKYVRGVVKPLTKPQFGSPDEVVVTFVKYRGTGRAIEPDEQIFRMIEPQYRRIRRQVFKEQFPNLYEKFYGKKTKTRS